MKLLPILLLSLAINAAAYASDPCSGKNPLFCRPAPGPIIIEQVRVKPEGSLTTRTDRVISRDGETLMVIKGKDHNWNIGDVKDEPNYDE